MKLSKNAIGNLIARYASVLKRCAMINLLASGLIVLGASAAYSDTTFETWIPANSESQTFSQGETFSGASETVITAGPANKTATYNISSAATVSGGDTKNAKYTIQIANGYNLTVQNNATDNSLSFENFNTAFDIADGTDSTYGQLSLKNLTVSNNIIGLHVGKYGHATIDLNFYQIGTFFDL